MPASNDSLTRLIRESALFSALADEDLPSIAEVLVEVELPDDEDLFEEGEEIDGLFLVESGKLVGFDREGIIRNRYQRGDLIGLESSKAKFYRSETVRAQKNSRVWFIPGGIIAQLGKERPEFAETLKVLANSQVLVGQLYLPWLEGDERVSLITRKHPIFLFWAVLPPLLVFVAAIIALAFLQAQIQIWAIIGMLFTFFVCGIWLAWNINNWANDFYLITSKRMVWVERVSGFYESRQEAPLGTLISVGVATNHAGAFFGYSDVLVRTYYGDVRFERIAHAQTIAKLVENFWAKTKQSDFELDAKEIRKALREKFGKPAEEVSSKEIEEQYGIDNELRREEMSFFNWLFSDFLKVRFDSAGTITYRKHWFVLLQKTILPLLGMLLAAGFLIAIITRNITSLDYNMSLVLAISVLTVCLLLLFYQYADWRNDVFQLTPSQIIDLDRKPFGRESRRTAPLENILSIEFERRGFFAMLFNFGTVFISVGNTQLTFNDVYQPSRVQQDIFAKMGNHAKERDLHQKTLDQERIAQWFKVYQDETADLFSSQDPTAPLKPPRS